jgi:metal-sulfur cluster biosynthetic enzyme
MQEDLLLALNEIEDPELGIGIVDLGLIYRADWNEKGIEVDFTVTSPSCPFGEILAEQVNDVLFQRFREAASIHVRQVLDPPWTPERISDVARQQIGWTREPPVKSAPGLGRGRGIWKN